MCGQNFVPCSTPHYPEFHPFVNAQKYVDNLITTAVGNFHESAGGAIIDRDPWAGIADFNQLTLALIRWMRPVELMSEYVHNPCIDTSQVVSATRSSVHYNSYDLVPPALYASAAAKAVQILTADPTTAAELFPEKMDPINRRSRISPTSVPEKWTYLGSALDGLYWRARADDIRPVVRLRYQVYSAHPSKPQSRDITTRVRRLPTMLWPDWTLRLLPSGLHSRYVRKALSMAVMLTGTNATYDEVARLLGLKDDNSRSTTALFKGFSRDGILTDALTAINRLADYLDGHDIVIDYARRRNLDLTDLLTEATWQRCCESASRPAGGPRVFAAARRFLDQRIVGQDRAAIERATAESATELMRRMTPVLLQALDEHAERFLLERDIAEPVTWSPPLDLIADLILQEWVAPTDANLTVRLHVERRGVRATADALCLPRRSLQLYLQYHPVPLPGGDDQ